jgi:hypothetical protein
MRDLTIPVVHESHRASAEFHLSEDGMPDDAMAALLKVVRVIYRKIEDHGPLCFCVDCLGRAEERDEL